VSSVIVDNSLFTGPSTAVGWDPEDAPSSYATEITATMVDGGRDAPTSTVRSASPDLAAGDALAAALTADQAAANGEGTPSVSRGTAAAGARVLATVSSPPIGTLIEQMLSESDNVLAEVLARQVAISAKQPASFVGAAHAVASTLAGIGVSVGSGMNDGSGLSGRDRVPAGVLSQVLLKAARASVAASSGSSQLRPLLAGLPVAGWDGTLAEQGRFAGTASSAFGVVRAKTGSLTGVSALAGVVTDRDGRLLVFSFVADQVPGGDPDSAAARVALDQAAAAVAGCGCR
jgi:D-alanyl-D-alanine carboxypeptidase/D-alanyl-D-alanine-endopeptidase (penicillin-binding protein 4)